jgi:hypothetical protein
MGASHGNNFFTLLRTRKPALHAAIVETNKKFSYKL